MYQQSNKHRRLLSPAATNQNRIMYNNYPAGVSSANIDRLTRVERYVDVDCTVTFHLNDEEEDREEDVTVEVTSEEDVTPEVTEVLKNRYPNYRVEIDDLDYDEKVFAPDDEPDYDRYDDDDYRYEHEYEW